MAIIKCVECGEKISDLAKMCPKCGAPSKDEALKIPRYITLAFGLIYSISFLYSLGALALSLFNRNCRSLFSNNTAELYWHCVGDHLKIYHAGDAFKIGFVALTLAVIAALIVNKLGSAK